MALPLGSSGSSEASVSATMRRRLSLAESMCDDGRRSSRFGSVSQYQLEKQLDLQQLDKIIYQPGCSYSSAVAGQHAASATDQLEFNLSGFSQHLARSQCLGVLLFWKEAEEYLNMFSQGDRAACAQRIFQRYMRRGAEFEINLSGIKTLPSRPSRRSWPSHRRTCSRTRRSVRTARWRWSCSRASGRPSSARTRRGRRATRPS